MKYLEAQKQSPGGVLKISQNSSESTFARVSFLVKLQAKSSNFIKKETLPPAFFWEFF